MRPGPSKSYKAAVSWAWQKSGTTAFVSRSFSLSVCPSPMRSSIVQTTDDLRILEITPLSAPARVIDDVPCSPVAGETVAASRAAVHRILTGEDDRLVVVVGPCSIHDPVAA